MFARFPSLISVCERLIKSDFVDLELQSDIILQLTFCIDCARKLRSPEIQVTDTLAVNTIHSHWIYSVSHHIICMLAVTVNTLHNYYHLNLVFRYTLAIACNTQFMYKKLKISNKQKSSHDSISLLLSNLSNSLQ